MHSNIRTRSRPRGAIVTAALRSSAGLIAAAAVVLSACATSHAPAALTGRLAGPRPAQFATTAQVLEAVKAAQSINDVPSSVSGFLTKADWPMATGRFDCHRSTHEVDLPANILDPSRISVRAMCSWC